MEKGNPRQGRRLEGEAKPDTRVALLNLPHRHYPDADALCKLLHGPPSFASAYADAATQ